MTSDASVHSPSTVAVDDWVCARCGSPGATPQAGFLSMDPRYAIGFCDTCNDPNANRKTQRPTQRLVRADLFDREEWTARREGEELAGLVQEFGKYRGPAGTIKMANKDVLRLVHLFDKYGFAGFHLPADARDAVADHNKRAENRAQYTKPKGRRRR